MSTSNFISSWFFQALKDRARGIAPVSLWLLALVCAPALAQGQVEAAAPDPATSTAREPEPESETVPARDVFDLLDEYVLGRRVEPQLEGDTPRGLQWAFVPTVSYNPVYGGAFGALISGAGRRGGEDSPYSTLAISANYSTQQQLQIQLRGELFSADADGLLKLDCRYLDTERSTWGLGGVRDQQEEFPMAFLLYRARATYLRRVRAPVYLGMGINYDQFHEIVDERAENGELTPYVEYSGGAPGTTKAIGISVNLLADTRDNLVAPTEGYYLNWSIHDYLTAFGSDQNWQEMWIEARTYPQLPKGSGNVLAFWMYSWLTFGPAPYLSLPSNGWDTYGRGARGYLAGRIRGANQVYIESEYRRPLTRDGLLGAVFFLNATSTASENSSTFGRLDPGMGVGLRIKFNKHNSTNLALDYAWGRADSRGLFLGMAEVF